MDLKLLSFNVCSIVVCLLICNTCATDEHSNSEQKPNTVAAILQDMEMAAGEHYQDEGGHEDKGFFSKGMKGGFDKGANKYGMDEYKKKGNDHGKSGHKKYDSKDNWGNNKYDKKKMDSHGEKWGDKSGKENKGKWEEWVDNKKWKTDKGKGYEKAYEYDKSDGMKNSFGKKGKSDSTKYEDKHGEKHGMKKKEAMGKDNFGKKLNNGKMDWQEYGKMYKMGGKNNKGMKKYESKKPSTHKMSKWEKMEKKMKKPPPKKHHMPEEHGEMEEHDGGYDQGGMEEEDHNYDQGGFEHDFGGHDEHEMAAEYDQGGEHLAYDQGAPAVATYGQGESLAYDQGGHQQLLPQDEAYAALAKAGYVLGDQSHVIPVHVNVGEYY